jgi:integrase
LKSSGSNGLPLNVIDIFQPNGGLRTVFLLYGKCNPICTAQRDRDASQALRKHSYREVGLARRKGIRGKDGLDEPGAPDLRRTCARLCRAAGGELDQIQFLLGQISVQTTERYLGCAQRIASAVNDKIGIEPAR